MAKGMSIDTLYFIGLIFISIASGFNGGLDSLFYTFGTGVFGYIALKIIAKYLGWK
jgi:hypothetical protein